LKPGADGNVDRERLHPDGILMSGDVKVFIEIFRCPESQVSGRIKEKTKRLAEVAQMHNAQYCFVILTKHEGKIHEEGTISIFDEYGKQSAKTRFTRERTTFDEQHRYTDENYAKVTAGRLKKNFRALARTLRTRCLDILLRSLKHGRTELKPPLRRKDIRVVTKNPASLNPLQSPRPSSLGEKSRLASADFMATKVGKILSGCQDEDGCAVRFTSAPCNKDRITVNTMTHLL